MYSKADAQLIKKEFWSTFGNEYPRKWLLYNTKIKDVTFKFNVDNKKAYVMLDIEPKDENKRKIYFEKVESLKEILVNELAPRPHNSGHQTIEGNYVSQFEQHLRAIFNLPLGDTRSISNAVMINLLGEKGHEGLAKYSGLEKIMAIDGVYVHLYGKKYTKPFRKMGHVTVVDQNRDYAIEKARFVQQTLKVIS